MRKQKYNYINTFIKHFEKPLYIFAGTKLRYTVFFSANIQLMLGCNSFAAVANNKDTWVHNECLGSVDVTMKF